MSDIEKFVEQVEDTFFNDRPKNSVGFTTIESVKEALDSGKVVIFNMCGTDRFQIDGIRVDGDEIRVREHQKDPKPPHLPGYYWHETWYVARLESLYTLDINL